MYGYKTTANIPPRFLGEIIKCRVTRQLWSGLADLLNPVKRQRQRQSLAAYQVASWGCFSLRLGRFVSSLHCQILQASNLSPLSTFADNARGFG